MQSSWFFYPKYGADIVEKVLTCFVDDYLSWQPPNRPGWMHLAASPDGNCDYYTETCFLDTAITGKELTDNMLILLTGQGGCAQEYSPDDPDNNDWTLEEVCVDEVLMCLSAEGTHIYAPCGEKLWMRSVDTGRHEMMDMIDFILTRKVA